MRIKFLVFSLAYTRYRGNWNRYHPLISYWKVNFRSSDFHISYWEKISKNFGDLQREDPLQKAIRPSNYSEMWRRNFQNSYSLTGSKLAANLSLSPLPPAAKLAGGIYSKYPGM